MDLNRLPFRVFFIGGCVFVLAFSLTALLSGTIDNKALVVCAFLTVTWALGAFLTFLRMPLRVFAASMQIALMIVNSSTAAAPLSSEDVMYRMRSQAIAMVIWKFVPGTFGLPLPMAMIHLVWSVASDVCVLHLSSQIFDDPTVARMYFASPMNACFGLAVAYMAQGRLGSLYIAHRELATEKETLDALLSMICDAAAWVSRDCTTVLRCDHRFDLLIGKRMQGKSLKSCLPDDEFQHGRLREALTRAWNTPVSLPLTLSLGVGAEIDVDCFVVRRVGAAVEPAGPKAKEALPDFLIGFRVIGQKNVIPPAHNIFSDDIRSRCEDLRGTHRQHIDEATTALSSVPETTDTGRIFSDLNLAGLVEGAGDDADDLRRRLETVVELGSREGWLLDAQHVCLQPDQVLGTGTFGAVFGATLHGTPVAVKVPRLSENCVYLKHLVTLANEVRILRHVRHPNVILFHGACVEPWSGEVLLVLERVHGAATLDSFLQNHCTPQDVSIRFPLLLEVICALRYLHAQCPKIVHGDLKPSNILVVPGEPHIKLIDFGLSRLLTRFARPLGGTLAWMAPELIQSRHCQPKPSADVYSFSFLAYMLVTCQEPLRGVKREAIIEQARSGLMHPLKWPDEGPLVAECHSLCSKILIFETEQRPSMKEVHLEVSAWRMMGHKASASVLETSMGELLLCGDNARDADKQTAAHWQDELRKVRDAVAQPLSTTVAEPGAIQQQRTYTGCAAGVANVQAESRDARVDLLFPDLHPTRLSAKQAMLLCSTMQWNFPITRSACCAFHALLEDLDLVCKSMRGMSCRGLGSPPLATPQCHTCGALYPEEYDEHGCEWCRSAGSQSGARSKLDTIFEDAADSKAMRNNIML